MKKLTVFALVVFLSVLLASGEDSQPINPDFVTNIVKTPITKGLYHTRTQDVQHSRTTDDTVVCALRFFKKTQNPDGSWGEGGDQNLATPLVLLSFLGRGETTSSHEFSNTVTLARTWLLNAIPTGTASRLATVVSLSAYCDLVYLSSHLEQKTNEIAKMQTLLNQVSPTNNDIWLDFAAFYTMPSDISKPSWMRHAKEAHERYVNATTNLAPLTVEEYLKMHMAALAAFHRGGKLWNEFNRTSTPELMNRQEPDGSFPISDGQCRFVATALAVLRLEISCQYEPRLQTKPESKLQKTEDKGIRIDVK